MHSGACFIPALSFFDADVLCKAVVDIQTLFGIKEILIKMELQFSFFKYKH